MAWVVCLWAGLPRTRPATAGNCFEENGRWPYGIAYDVAVRGSALYVLEGSALVVVDAADPALPRESSHFSFPVYGQHLAVDGSWLYVAAGPVTDGDRCCQGAVVRDRRHDRRHGASPELSRGRPRERQDARARAAMGCAPN